MERWHAKVICLVGIFILPLVCTLIPYKVHAYFARKGEKGKKILSCLMCFGGGVFFATFILHMGPEVRRILDKALIEPYHISYPVADAIMGAGFFLVFFMEKVILKCYKKRHLNKVAKRKQQCYQFNKVNSTVTNHGDSYCDSELSQKDRNNIVQVSNGHVASHTASPGEPRKPTDCPLLGTGDCCNDDEVIKLQMSDSDEMKLGSVQEGPAAEQDEDTLHAHNTRSLVLVVALSLHRIFEGMSLGLQQSTQNVWNLFIAVLCHETVIGFGLGLQFVKNQFSLRKMLIATILCSLIMPIGVMIGTVLIEAKNESDVLNLINGILQGISTGTFIYVTFFEILQEEIDPHDTSMSKFFSVFLGFLVMAALCAIPETTEISHTTTDATTMTSIFNTTLLVTVP